MEAGEVTMEVSLTLDENGILDAQAYVPGTNKHLYATIIYKLKFEYDDITSKTDHVSEKKYAVGIDLGTTSSAIGVWHQERVELVENIEGELM